MDKSKPRQKIMYRIEVWIGKEYKSENNLKNYPLPVLKEHLEKAYGCSIEEKSIPMN